MALSIKNKVFGLCKIMSGDEVVEEFEQNECFAKCDDLPDSNYLFYVDMETGEYFASPRNEEVK